MGWASELCVGALVAMAFLALLGWAPMVPDQAKRLVAEALKSAPRVVINIIDTIIPAQKGSEGGSEGPRPGSQVAVVPVIVIKSTRMEVASGWIWVVDACNNTWRIPAAQAEANYSQGYYYVSVPLSSLGSAEANISSQCWVLASYRPGS